MGGSQGSSFLNRTVSRSAMLVKERTGGTVQFIHLTGRKDYEDVRRFYEDNGIPARVFSFLDRIDDAYAACDLAVTRSGAAALFELAYYARPMILVPYPNPANNQRFNARYFSEAGAAVYKEEKEITPDGLADEILSMLSDDQRRLSAARAAEKLSAPGAGKRLAEEVVSLVSARDFVYNKTWS